MNDVNQLQDIVTAVLDKYIQPIIHEQVDGMVCRHLDEIIATATDEATKAIARRLLELVVKDSLAKGTTT